MQTQTVTTDAQKFLQHFAWKNLHCCVAVPVFFFSAQTGEPTDDNIDAL